jgi:hypothetical protein
VVLELRARRWKRRCLSSCPGRLRRGRVRLLFPEELSVSHAVFHLRVLTIVLVFAGFCCDQCVESWPPQSWGDAPSMGSCICMMKQDQQQRQTQCSRQMINCCWAVLRSGRLLCSFAWLLGLRSHMARPAKPAAASASAYACLSVCRLLGLPDDNGLTHPHDRYYTPSRQECCYPSPFAVPETGW